MGSCWPFPCWRTAWSFDWKPASADGPPKRWSSPSWRWSPSPTNRSPERNVDNPVERGPTSPTWVFAGPGLLLLTAVALIAAFNSVIDLALLSASLLVFGFVCCCWLLVVFWLVGFVCVLF